MDYFYIVDLWPKCFFFFSKYNKRVKRINIPDKSFFNKNEGNEVLYIINLLSFVEDSCDLERAENLIRNYMPLNIKSQIDVFNWLEINWELIEF